MTQNQINFAKHREDVRHNAEMERQGLLQIAESQRHNKESEAINWYTGAADVAYRNMVTQWYPFEVGTKAKNPISAITGAVTSIIGSGKDPEAGLKGTPSEFWLLKGDKEVARTAHEKSLHGGVGSLEYIGN